MNDARHVAVFTEGDFERIYNKPTLAQARAFVSGLSTGAGYYAGSLTAYVLPEDEEEMRGEESAEQASRAVASWKETAK